jgi:hypothetical protein
MEREAFRRYWQSRLEEHRREDQDAVAYSIIMKNIFSIISDLYRESLHYQHIRSRPFNSIAYEVFLGKYELLLQKSDKMADSGISKRYRKRFRLITEFLEAFLENLELEIPAHREKRASALHSFGAAVQNRDRFLASFFASSELDRNDAVEGLKESLSGFEKFIKAYSSSPLIDYADVMVDLLEKLYRAFIKDES